jgi:hypothetical protein
LPVIPRFFAKKSGLIAVDTLLTGAPRLAK